MTCKANSTCKSITFQPIPMALLIANLKELAAPITMRDSSDSSDESSSSDVYSKKTQSETVPTSGVKMPLSENRGAAKAPSEIKIKPSPPRRAERASNKENVYGSSKAYRIPGVDVLPTIELATSQPMTVVEKKKCARYLFLEPAKDPPLPMAPPTQSEAHTSSAIHPPEVLADSQSLSTQPPTQPTRQAQTPSMVETPSYPAGSRSTSKTQPTSQAQTPSMVATPSYPAGPRSTGKTQPTCEAQIPSIIVKPSYSAGPRSTGKTQLTCEAQTPSIIVTSSYSAGPRSTSKTQATSQAQTPYMVATPSYSAGPRSTGKTQPTCEAQTPSMVATSSDPAEPRSTGKTQPTCEAQIPPIIVTPSYSAGPRSTGKTQPTCEAQTPSMVATSSDPAEPRSTGKTQPTCEAQIPPIIVTPSYSAGPRSTGKTQPTCEAQAPSMVATSSDPADPRSTSKTQPTCEAQIPSIIVTPSYSADPRSTGKTQPTCEAQTPSMVATSSDPANPRSTGKIHFKTVNVKGKKYMVMKKLGTGGSSEVFKILEISTSTEYAVKCVDLETDRELAKGYLNEVKLLRDLQKSDRVVKLYDYEYDRENNFLRLVMEVGETDLACFLRAHRDGAPPALVLHYWEEMLRAVQQIHEHGIVHADLKPANFLLVAGRLKLIDFGIASAVSSDVTSVARSCRKGTFSYISPEALGGGEKQNACKVSFYSDVWSLGCILYSLIYGYTPFAHLATRAKLVVIGDPNHTIHYPPTDCIPPSLMTALQRCLRYDAHSRPTVAQLLQMRHLQYPRETRPLPEALLNKLAHIVSEEDFELLQKAEVYEN